jgi:hypothetical protein
VRKNVAIDLSKGDTMQKRTLGDTYSREHSKAQVQTPGLNLARTW